MKHFLLLAIIATLLCSCKKDDEDCPPDLPCATQVGANTFGCYINGEPWVAEIGNGIFDPLIKKTKSRYDEVGIGAADNYYFYLSATYASLPDSVMSDFIFNLRPVYGSGQIDFPSLNRKDIKYVLGQPGLSTNTTTYLLDTLYPIKFHFSKLDTKANVCAGTFAFRLINALKKDTLEISAGRFDVTYQPD